jgi:hypothetical protein
MKADRDRQASDPAAVANGMTGFDQRRVEHGAFSL